MYRERKHDQSHLFDVVLATLRTVRRMVYKACWVMFGVAKLSYESLPGPRRTIINSTRMLYSQLSDHINVIRDNLYVRYITCILGTYGFTVPDRKAVTARHHVFLQAVYTQGKSSDFCGKPLRKAFGATYRCLFAIL